MGFKIGDRVLFKKEKQEGVIHEIKSSYFVVVKTTDDFHVDVSINDIILRNDETNSVSAYGSDIVIKDTKIRQVSKNKNNREKDNVKLDLHIELLVEDYNMMSISEILQIQLKECRKKLDYMINNNSPKLTIVHGIGTGRLKEEVHRILKDYGLRYYLSQDGGATEVMF